MMMRLARNPIKLNTQFNSSVFRKTKNSTKKYRTSLLLKENGKEDDWDFFFSGGGNSSGGELGSKLGQVNWESLTLETIKKDIYEEDASVAAMSTEDVDAFRAKFDIQFIGRNKPPHPVLSFDQLKIQRQAKKRLMKDFEKPTPIQSNVWPIIMKGDDLVGSAETGSGKTLGFLVPMFEHIVAQTDIEAWPKALVIAPTRELVRQIHSASLPYANDYQVTSLFAHGGSQNRKKQEMDIRKAKPELLIASPGRVIDFVENGLISLEKVSILALDEADLLLQMGFEAQIKMILSQVRPDKQALMFSATWPSSVQQLARKYFKNYVHLNVGSLSLSANPRINQNFIFSRSFREKKDALIALLSDVPGKVLIFMRTKSNCENLKLDLEDAGLKKVGSLHGDHTQNQREKELNNFHRGSTRILLCTDLASRGIDVKDIERVVNFDMPESIDIYIHRIGRTARAGTNGSSYSFISPNDVGLVPDLVKVLQDANQEVPAQLTAAASRGRGNNTTQRYGRGNVREGGRNNYSRNGNGYNNGRNFSRNDNNVDRANRSDRRGGSFSDRGNRGTGNRGTGNRVNRSEVGSNFGGDRRNRVDNAEKGNSFDINKYFDN